MNNEDCESCVYWKRYFGSAGTCDIELPIWMPVYINRETNAWHTCSFWRSHNG